jgi:hypothetical protein
MRGDNRIPGSPKPLWPFLILLATAACARDPAPGTPAAAAEGERLMRSMSDTLAAAPAFRFTTDESLEPIAGTGGRVLRFSRGATVRRPNAMAFELDGSAETPADVSAYYDGTSVSLRDNRNGVWATATAPGTLDEMFDDVARRYGMPVPIADVAYSVPYEAFIGRTTKGGFVGRETIDGVRCARLDYADEFVDVRIWIPSRGQPLPKRLELVYKQASGSPKARIEFESWDLAPKIADGAFTFQAGDAAKQVSFEQFTAAMLSRGEPPSPAGAGGSAPGTAQRQ